MAAADQIFARHSFTEHQSCTDLPLSLPETDPASSSSRLLPAACYLPWWESTAIIKTVSDRTVSACNFRTRIAAAVRFSFAVDAVNDAEHPIAGKYPVQKKKE